MQIESKRSLIRQLNQHDHAQVTGYLQREREVNLFMLGDIENFGYDDPIVAHWGEFDAQGQLQAVLTRYYDNLLFYSRDAYDAAGFLGLIQTLRFKVMSGESSIVEPFWRALDFCRRKDTILSKLSSAAPVEVEPALLTRVQEARPGNIPQILDLLGLIAEFDYPPQYQELQQKFLNRTGRAYFIEEGGRIISIAQTAAETTQSAMIVGVASHPQCRRHGYASACMIKLCRDLLAEGKAPCLFYNNPAAGRIYRRLGFADIGQWAMLLR